MNRNFRASITSAAVAGLLSGTNVALKVAIRLSVAAAALAATLSPAQGATLTSAPADAAPPAPTPQIMLARGGADDGPGDLRRGRGTDDPVGDVRRGRGRDDLPGNDHGGV